MGDEAKSVESVMEGGMRKLLIRVAKRERKKMPLKREKKRVQTLFLFGKKKTCAKRKRRDEEAMEGRRDMEKTCPLQRKHFDQTFLKSLMRGANPQGGDGGTNPLRYEVRKRMEISGKEYKSKRF